MSGLIKKPEQLNEQPQLSDLEKLQLEFKQFRKISNYANGKLNRWRW